MTLHVAVFDDVLAARREVFHIPGLEIQVFGDADNVLLLCSGEEGPVPDILCMDYAMGPDHVNGEDAIRPSGAMHNLLSQLSHLTPAIAA